MPLFRAPRQWQEQVAPAGAIDGANVVFTTPDFFDQDPPDYQIKVMRNGQQQTLGGDYTVSESGGAGTGYDTVTFAVACTPKSGEIVLVDYVID
jgi:hypothetical protein